MSQDEDAEVDALVDAFGKKIRAEILERFEDVKRTCAAAGITTTQVRELVQAEYPARPDGVILIEDLEHAAGRLARARARV